MDTTQETTTVETKEHTMVMEELSHVLDTVPKLMVQLLESLNEGAKGNYERTRLREGLAFAWMNFSFADSARNFLPKISPKERGRYVENNFTLVAETELINIDDGEEREKILTNLEGMFPAYNWMEVRRNVEDHFGI
jgi:hypothetical protein